MRRWRSIGYFVWITVVLGCADPFRATGGLTTKKIPGCLGFEINAPLVEAIEKIQQEAKGPLKIYPEDFLSRDWKKYFSDKEYQQDGGMIEYNNKKVSFIVDSDLKIFNVTSKWKANKKDFLGEYKKTIKEYGKPSYIFNTFVPAVMKRNLKDWHNTISFYWIDISGNWLTLMW